MDLSRRIFCKAAAATLFVAPAIVRASSLMKIQVLNENGIYQVTDPVMTATEVRERWARMTADTVQKLADEKAFQEMFRREFIAGYEYAQINYIDGLRDTLTGPQSIDGVIVTPGDRIRIQ